ncbi:MAG: glycoside hydrolase family 127 protein, partial [Clostridia bacterium]|nr:glycoside hydrolase family 127 protein [Clostridia bacterium]
LEIRVQTHATLTACRGILRLYEKDRDPEKLAFVQKIFRLYTEEGMTANYANYNWFGRPEWTEPCAIIDSFMIACQLYACTDKQKYAELAHKILYNGVYASQRPNGGFGTDTCTGADGLPDSDLLVCSCYEAYWCCSMRGGEGLASVSRYSILELTAEEAAEKNSCPNTAVVLYPADGTYTVHGVKILVRTSYPMPGKTTFRILENPGNKPLALTFPKMQFVKPQFGMAVFTSGEIVCDIEVNLHMEETEGKHNGSGNILYAGYQILGHAYTGEHCATPDVKTMAQNGRQWNTPDGTAWIPITERYLDTPEEMQKKKIQIIPK